MTRADELLGLADGAAAEQWKVAAATDRQYEVSNLGRVRRADGLMLTPSVPRSKREYPCVMLRHSGQRKRVAVHRLVAINFLSLPPFPGAEVRHLDGNHLNPLASNLAWGSRKDNAADRDRHGTTARGDRHGMKGKGSFGQANGNYRVTAEMKARACELVSQGHSQRSAADAVGITQKSVWQALRALASIETGAAA